jgi:hypothetical protein
MRVASWKPVVATVLALTCRGTASAANAHPGASADADHCSSFKTALVKWPDPTTRLLAGGLAAERVASTAKAIIRSYYARDPEDGVRDSITAAFGSCAWPKVEGELKHRMCPTTGNASCLTQAQISVLNREPSLPPFGVDRYFGTRPGPGALPRPWLSVRMRSKHLTVL